MPDGVHTRPPDRQQHHARAVIQNHTYEPICHQALRHQSHSVVEPRRPGWILDSGTSGHFSYEKDYFQHYEKDERDSRVTVANGHQLKIEGWGILCFQITKDALTPLVETRESELLKDEGGTFVLYRVGYVPEMSVNLISTMELGRDGYDILIKAGCAEIIQSEQRRCIMSCYWIQNAYMMPMRLLTKSEAKDLLKGIPGTPDYVCTAALTPVQQDILLWHRRLGHVGISSLRNIYDSTDGMPETVKRSVTLPSCVPCALSRRQRNTFGRSDHIAKKPLEYVHVDIAGPFVPSTDGFRYFVVFLDDFSRYHWVWLLKTRQQDEIVGVFEVFIARANVDVNGEYQVQHIHADNEFNVPKLNSLCRRNGIHQSFITPYTPQHNSRVERLMRTLKEPAAAMMSGTGLPRATWSFAVLAAAHIRNLVGHQSLGNVSPFQRLKHLRPDLKDLRIFGCLAFPMLQAPQRGAAPGTRWADKSRPGVFVGYSMVSEGWLIWFPQTNVVLNSIEIHFDEDSIWKWDPPLEYRKNLERQGMDFWDEFEDRSPMPRPARYEDDPENVDRNFPALPRQELLSRPQNTTAEDARPADPTPVPPEVTVETPRQEPRDVTVTTSRPSEALVPRLPADMSAENTETYGRTRAQTREINQSSSGQTRPQQSSQAATHDAVAGPYPTETSHSLAAAQTQWEEESTHYSFTEHLNRIWSRCPTDQEFQRTVFHVASTLCHPKTQEFGILTIPQRHEQAHLTTQKRPNTVCALDGQVIRISDLMRRDDWPAWRAAMQEEWNSLVSRETFEHVDKLPEGKNLVGHKWVLVTKRNLDGNIRKHKARLVAQGFTQIYGIDYNETFSPTVGIETLRLMFKMGVQEDYCWKLLDVSCAYLYGSTTSETYMVCPEGFSVGDPAKATPILRVHRSLYGLRASGREWYETFSSRVLALGFRRCYVEPCAFVHENGTIIIIYVDDLKLMAKTPHLLSEMQQLLEREFSMTESTENHTFLGMAIKKHSGAVHIHQRTYIEDCLKRYQMDSLSTVSTPLDIGKEIPPPSKEPVDAEVLRSFLSQIGSLLWASRLTRPDIHQAVTKLARAARGPLPEHFDALKRVWRYLRGTLDLGLVIEKDLGEHRPYLLSAFSDSNFADPSDGRRSTSGLVIMLLNSPVTWVSSLQSVIASATTDAEYIALSDGARDLISTANLLIDLFGSDIISRPYILFCDNNNAILASSMTSNHTKIRHVDLHYHKLMQWTEAKLVSVQRVDTKDNIADAMTKALRPAALEAFRQSIKLLPIP
ncbi:unnamed protein product [Parajaminaea phylloscopi]